MAGGGGQGGTARVTPLTSVALLALSQARARTLTMGEVPISRMRAGSHASDFCSRSGGAGASAWLGST